MISEDKIIKAKEAIREGKTIHLLTINIRLKNSEEYIDLYEDLNHYYADFKDGKPMISYCKDAIELEDLGIELVMMYTGGKPTNNFGLNWYFEIMKEE